MTAAAARRPIYARVLRLRHLRLSGLLCFILFEGMIALGVLLALAELTNWWAVVALPAAVALMVKLNDVLTGALTPAWSGPTPTRSAADGPTVAGLGNHPDPAASTRPQPVRARAAVPRPPTAARAVRPVTTRDVVGTMDPVDSPRQRFRQSAAVTGRRAVAPLAGLSCRWWPRPIPTASRSTTCGWRPGCGG
jgi:hypothetical protein